MSRLGAAAVAPAAPNRALDLSAGALAAGLLLGSRWEQSLGGPAPLILGRLVLALTAGGLALSLATKARHVRSARGTLPRLGALLIVALTGETIVILVSVATHGSDSAGAFAGYGEMALVATLTLALVQIRPSLASTLLICAAGGALIGSLEALASGNTTEALHGVSGRLTGHYGNPNFLGLAASLAVPLFLALALGRTPRRAAPWWLALVLACAAIVLSYSRGAILAAAAGGIAAIAMARGGLRARLRVGAAGCLAFAALAGATYPVYSQLRTHADFAPAVGAGSPDRSGWDPRAQGLIPDGPSKLRNGSSAKGISISAHAPGEGASLPLGQLSATARYRLTVSLSSPVTGLEAGVGLEDNLLGAGPVLKTLLIRPRPDRLQMQWQPTRSAPHARLYLWLPRGGAMTVRTARFGVAGSPPRSLPVRLLGPSDAIARLQSASEARFVHSREDAASLALRLFAENPLMGVGWQRFTAYSATHLRYGPLATHDEYLRYAAELGLAGLSFLLLAISVVVRGSMRLDAGSTGAAAACCALAGAVGLLFVNALEVPSVALPLAVAAAVLCTDVGKHQPLRLGPMGR